MEYLGDMRISRLWLVLGLIVGVQCSSWSQSTILDDTTKNVYGPKTTRFFLEKDLLQNRDTLRMVDTSLNATHQYDMVQRLDNMYQDLGLIGTAIRPIYFQMPEQIGTQLGMDAYQPYVLHPDKVKYFNTRSPFTQALYGQNTRGNQKIHFRYTRNINERFNIGLLYRRENTHKQFGGETTRDLAADHHSLAIHAAYQSKNKRYRLLYNFAHLNQMVQEQGGIVLGESDTLANGEVRVDSLFGYELEASQLGLTARSWQTQNTHHLYHEYALFKQLQLFHILNLSRQRDDYEDTGITTSTNQDFYRPFATDPDMYVYNSNGTSEGFKYRLFDNMAGVKGSIGPIYYQGYARARQYKLTHSREGQVEGVTVRATDDLIINGVTIPQFTLDSIPTRINTNNTELFLGGAFGINFNQFSRLYASAEYALTARSDYRISVAFESRGLIAKLQSSFTTPTLAQQRFASNHFIWDRTNLNNMLANEASISYDIHTSWFTARPFGSYTLINDYIYFNEQALPTQAPELVQIASGGVDFHVRWRSLNMRTKAVLSKSLGSTEYLRVPEILVNSRIYCEDCLLTKLMHTQIGFEVHYKSAYKADAYMPVSKQFYLQDNVLSPAYALVDFFFNVQIGRVRVFLKMSHLNHIFNSNQGYITTPTFVGMRSAFNVGFNWMFFN
ncbi:putative porin [Microscilla marina]|uniref:Beta-barrel porin n=1 Tax=Microscilla marina ATCC 23134 TaxID=313606 RepID=A1ZDE1_MICM2|nr:putative porin [Microscilla marina]EAY31680.1 hypothetical protein M23134_05186 [Microscilla marina ATCC 23134]